jgi:hypothetical protein
VTAPTQEERKALFTSFGLNAPLDFIQKLPPSAQMGALIGGLLGGALGLAVDEKTIDALPKVGPSLPKRHGEPLHEETMPVNHLHLDVVVHNVHHNLVRAIDTFDRNTGEKNEYKLIAELFYGWDRPIPPATKETHERPDRNQPACPRHRGHHRRHRLPAG